MTSSEANVSSRATPLGENDPRTLGNYTLLGKLGQGGMGTVYLGRSELGRLVAIKVVRADVADDAQFRSRFRQEAATARRVARVCTAEVLDFDPEAEQPYLVTEFIEGPTLQSFVSRGGPLADANLEQLAVGVAAALRAIHAAGIVHRDLKPSNVVLSPFGPRVIDFGIARALDSGAGLTGDLQQLGTPAFMSPEQVRGDPITSKADIWAWGGLVTFAATGQYPFGAGSAQVLLFRALNEEPRLDGVDPALRPIVWDSMRKNPYERPNASQLMDRLLGDAGDTGDQNEQVTNVLADWKVPPAPAGGRGPATSGGPGQADYATLAATRPGQPADENYVPTQAATRYADAPSVGAQQYGHPGQPQYGHPGQAPAGQPEKRRGRRPLILGIVAAVVVIAALAAVLPMVLKDKDKSNDPSAFLPRSAAPLGLDTMVLAQKVGSDPKYHIVTAQVPDPDNPAAGGPPITQFKPVISGPDDLLLPAISPDRQTIFYIDQGVKNTMMAIAADGSGQSVPLFTSGPAANISIVRDARPSISPEGKFVVIRSTTDETGQARPGLYIIAMDGSSVRRLDTAPQATDPSWSPDGERIAYWSSETGGDRGFLVVISAEPGSKAVPLNKAENATTGNLDADPTWSSDGKQLAFSRLVKGNDSNGGTDELEVYVMDVSTKKVGVVTKERGADDQDPAWSPGSSSILTFTSNRDPNNPGDREIYMTNVRDADKPDRQLTTGHGYHGQLRWDSR
ncbi:protein kinase domain-containing protein [Pseudofrankia asymbiotica]|uniref:Serine/threonine protein kinase n=1 Tax=Pseudofrankia asymbiotica TaxID=1834516 RepID=A0A1V2IC40_9ACTN|nr:protein kinase [Pseudofrankia asymbiotica]ONH29728.1 serine/threonine protein kinase [Pseudofrankia asymbiotica]